MGGQITVTAAACIIINICDYYYVMKSLKASQLHFADAEKTLLIPQCYLRSNSINEKKREINDSCNAQHKTLAAILEIIKLKENHFRWKGSKLVPDVHPTGSTGGYH